MPQTRTVTTAWIHTKVCPCCGYRGPEVQSVEDTETFECPVCANDLYARPPMSYAQMEGLSSPGQVDQPCTANQKQAACAPACCDVQTRAGLFARVTALIRRLVRR